MKILIAMVTTWFWLTAGPAFGDEPPQLSNLTVDPQSLQAGTGTQFVHVAVAASDADGNLNPAKVKARVKFDDVTKQKIVLIDDGTGLYRGQLGIDTTISQSVQLKIKAKDFASNKASPLP